MPMGHIETVPSTSSYFVTLPMGIWIPAQRKQELSLQKIFGCISIVEFDFYMYSCLLHL